MSHESVGAEPGLADGRGRLGISQEWEQTESKATMETFNKCLVAHLLSQK